jgi:hypothetical protein
LQDEDAGFDGFQRLKSREIGECIVSGEVQRKNSVHPWKNFRRKNFGTPIKNPKFRTHMTFSDKEQSKNSRYP